MLEREIGKRIHSARRSKGLRLADLASSSGFSAGLLSKIERGKVSSPISTLDVIARALGTSFEEIIANGHKVKSGHETSSEITIIKKKERSHYDVEYDGTKSTYELLSPHMDNKLMEPFVITLPDQGAPTVYSHHPGQELVFVLQGKVLFNYRRQNYLLEEGDCAYFDASVAHRVRCGGDGEAKVLCVRSVI
jgi:transcriptional regulator with XRE-family HTH domain